MFKFFRLVGNIYKKKWMNLLLFTHRIIKWQLLKKIKTHINGCLFCNFYYDEWNFFYVFQIETSLKENHILCCSLPWMYWTAAAASSLMFISVVFRDSCSVAFRVSIRGLFFTKLNTRTTTNKNEKNKNKMSPDKFKREND